MHGAEPAPVPPVRTLEWTPTLTTDVLAAWGAFRFEWECGRRIYVFFGDIAMTTRTTQTVARFSSPFLLPGFDQPQPAGDYRVDQDEELIEGVSRLAWRRVSAFIHLPAIAAKGSMRQMVAINPADLDAVLEKDHERT
jgi:hypothetical protein